jgi:diacylglycerol kinase (ATP)
MRTVLIINPVSGSDEPNSEQVPAIEGWLAKGSIVPEVLYTSLEKSGAELAREAIAKGAEVILVGGGDGTVGEVARELIRKPVTLGILPIGTFNNIARSVAIPTDLEQACAIVTAGRVREIDVGVANDEHFFFEAAGAGLDATLFPIGEEIKGGRWSRVFQAAKLTLQYKVQPVALTFDCSIEEALPPGKRRRFRRRRWLSERTIHRSALLIVVANGPYYGGGFAVSPGARLADGRLTVSIYRNFSKLELARHFWSIAYGKRRYSPKIETYLVKEVSLTSPVDLPVHVDGQPFGNLPITLRAVPAALRVLAPPRAAAKPDPDPPVSLPAPSEAPSRT